MKTKLLFGLTTVSVASLFWACGSGDICKFDREGDDQFVMYDYAVGGETADNALHGMVQQAITDYCAANNAGPDCNETLQPGGAAATQPQSSSSLSYKPIDRNDVLSNNSNTPTSQGGQNPSSGGITVVDPVNNNPQQGGNSSSPAVPTSSSGNPVVQPTQSSASGDYWAECQINGQEVVKKGASVAWKAQAKMSNSLTMQEMMQLKYSWTFEGGAVPTGSNMNETVVYPNSGTFKTVLTLTKASGATQVVPCPILEVTGAEVTGCKCVAASETVDISAVGGNVASWAVSGCMSTDMNFTYEWSDNLGNAASAGATMMQKGTVTPTVKVKNGDNGLMQVTCQSVQAIDSKNPDYIIKATQAIGAIKIPAGKTSVTLAVGAQNNTVFCNVARTDSPTGALKGSVNGVALAGSDYVSATVTGLTSGAMLNFELDVAATCGVQ